MKRTIRPNPTSWDLPLSGRTDWRTGSRGRRRRTTTRTAAGAQIVDRPSMAFPRLLLRRVSHTGRVVLSADDYGLVDQRLIAAPVVIQAEPEGRHGDQWSRIEWFIRTDHISGDVPIVFILEPLCPLLHCHGLALAVVVMGRPSQSLSQSMDRQPTLDMSAEQIVLMAQVGLVCQQRLMIYQLVESQVHRLGLHACGATRLKRCRRACMNRSTRDCDNPKKERHVWLADQILSRDRRD
jgi:hypothetical protein